MTGIIIWIIGSMFVDGMLMKAGKELSFPEIVFAYFLSLVFWPVMLGWTLMARIEINLKQEDKP